MSLNCCILHCKKIVFFLLIASRMLADIAPFIYFILYSSCQFTSIELTPSTFMANGREREKYRIINIFCQFINWFFHYMVIQKLEFNHMQHSLSLYMSYLPTQLVKITKWKKNTVYWLIRRLTYDVIIDRYLEISIPI